MLDKTVFFSPLGSWTYVFSIVSVQHDSKVVDLAWLPSSSKMLLVNTSTPLIWLILNYTVFELRKGT